MYKEIMMTLLATFCLGQTLKAETDREKFWKIVRERTSSENPDPLKITELSLSGSKNGDENKLQELTNDIQLFKNLKGLDLSDNLLRTLPPEIGMLEHLEVINVKGNPGIEFPPEFWSLRNIKRIEIDTFQGKIPDEIMSFAGLEVIMLDQLSDIALQELSRNYKMIYFLLSTPILKTYSKKYYSRLYIKNEELQKIYFNILSDTFHNISKRDAVLNVINDEFAEQDDGPAKEYKEKVLIMKSTLPQPLHEEIVPELEYPKHVYMQYNLMKRRLPK